MAFRISTTGVISPVVINDLGARSFTHPTVQYDLEFDYTQEEIRFSADLQAALDNNYLTAEDAAGNPITNVTEAVAHGGLAGLMNDDHDQYVLTVGSHRVKTNVNSPQERQVMVYDSTGEYFYNADQSADIEELNDIGDVNITAPVQQGDILVYDSTTQLWINQHGGTGGAGTSGSSGSSGSSGTSGSCGISGTSGSSGSSGSSGTSGVDGNDGTSGSSGSSG